MKPLKRKKGKKMNRPNLFVVICLVVSVVFAVAGCGDKTPEPEEQAADKAIEDFKAAPDAPAPPETPMEPTAEDTGEAKPVEGEEEETPPEATKPETPQAETALAMVTKPLKTVVSLAGCLKENVAAKGTARSAPTGGPQQDTVTLTKGEASITVHHAITHNCCYKATVKTEMDGHKIKVLEALFGDTCRCMCNSTITTTIDLPGPKFFKQYKVTVKVDNNGTPGTTHEQTIFF
jgi:cytoskeletal protein RodZ